MDISLTCCFLCFYGVSGLCACCQVAFGGHARKLQCSAQQGWFFRPSASSPLNPSLCGCALIPPLGFSSHLRPPRRQQQQQPATSANSTHAHHAVNISILLAISEAPAKRYPHVLSCAPQPPRDSCIPFRAFGLAPPLPARRAHTPSPCAHIYPDSTQHHHLHATSCSNCSPRKGIGRRTVQIPVVVLRAVGQQRAVGYRPEDEEEEEEEGEKEAEQRQRHFERVPYGTTATRTSREETRTCQTVQ